MMGDYTITLFSVSERECGVVRTMPTLKEGLPDLPRRLTRRAGGRGSDLFTHEVQDDGAVVPTNEGSVRNDDGGKCVHLHIRFQ